MGALTRSTAQRIRSWDTRINESYKHRIFYTHQSNLPYREKESLLMRTNKRNRRGFSLLELLAVVTILGIIAAMVIPRISTSSDTAKANVHAQNKAEINAAVERYYVNVGSWPSADLNEMLPVTSYDYFPNGLPANPLGGAAYTISTTTHRVDTP